MQRLTDIWQNLIQRLPNNREVQQIEDQRGPDEQSSENEAIGEQFRNLYWTRLVSL